MGMYPFVFFLESGSNICEIDYTQNNVGEDNKSNFSSRKMCFWEGDDSWSAAHRHHERAKK